MGKIRFIATGNVFDNESFLAEYVENLRQEIEALCDSYGILNIKVSAEDDYCIRINDQTK